MKSHLPAIALMIAKMLMLINLMRLTTKNKIPFLLKTNSWVKIKRLKMMKI